ncbi:MAG: hypothetical protein K6B65_02190 [Bacilli bacterium]|nr:hypothetical protein [Bacilli bacterium]
MGDSSLKKLLDMTEPFLSASIKTELSAKVASFEEERSFDPHSYFASGGIIDKLRKVLPCWSLTEGELPYMKKEEIVSYMASLEELRDFLKPYYEDGIKDLSPLYKNEELYKEDRPDLSDEEHVRMFMEEISYCAKIKNPFPFRIDKPTPLEEDSFRILNPYHKFDAEKYEDLDYPNREFTLPRAKYVRLKREYESRREEPSPRVAPVPTPSPRVRETRPSDATRVKGKSKFIAIFLYILLPFLLLGGSGYACYSFLPTLYEGILLSSGISLYIYAGIAFLFTFLGALLNQFVKPALEKAGWSEEKRSSINRIQCAGFWLFLILSSFLLAAFIPYLAGQFDLGNMEKTVVHIFISVGYSLLLFLLRLMNKSYKGGKFFFLQPIILPLFVSFSYLNAMEWVSGSNFAYPSLIIFAIPFAYLLLDSIIPAAGKRLFKDYYDPREPSPLVSYLYGLVGYFILPAAAFLLAFGLFHLFSIAYAALKTPFIDYDGSEGITPLLSDYRFWITIGLILVPSTIINVLVKKWMKILHRFGFDTYNRGEGVLGFLRAVYASIFYVGFVLLLILYYQPIMYRAPSADVSMAVAKIIFAFLCGIPMFIRTEKGAPACLKLFASMTLFGLIFHAANLMAFSDRIFVTVLVMGGVAYVLPYLILTATRPSGYVG